MAPWSRFDVQTVQPYAECHKIGQRPETLRLRGIPLRKPHGTPLIPCGRLEKPPQNTSGKKKAIFLKKNRLFSPNLLEKSQITANF